MKLANCEFSTCEDHTLRVRTFILTWTKDVNSFNLMKKLKLLTF